MLPCPHRDTFIKARSQHSAHCFDPEIWPCLKDANARLNEGNVLIAFKHPNLVIQVVDLK